MANTTIVLKKSGVPGNVPSVLANGEISINYADGKLFYRAANGTIQTISGSGGGGGSTNSFATVNANSSLILATSSTDTLSIVPGNGISIAANTTSKTITINSTSSANVFSSNTVNTLSLLANTANISTLNVVNHVVTGNANIASLSVTNIYANNYYYANGTPFSGSGGGGGGGGNVSSSGWTANSVITANSTGYLSSPANLQFFTSNNTLVVTGNVVGGGVNTTSSPTPPASPTTGDLWYNTSTDVMYRWTFDGTNYYWIDNVSSATASNGSLLQANVTYNSVTANTINVSTIYANTLNVIENNVTFTGNISSNSITTGNISSNSITTTSVYANSYYFANGSVLTTGSNVPKITGLVVTNSSYIANGWTAVSNTGGYMLVNGSGFVAGATVLIGSKTASSTGFVSANQLQVQVPAQVDGTYPVYVTNPDGGVAINVPGLTYNDLPVWSTGSTLPNGVSNSAISIQLSATDTTTVTYSLASGSTLPTGLTLSSSGLLSGTVSTSVVTVYTFAVNAVDIYSQNTSQTFSITIVIGDTYFPYTSLLLSASTNSANTTGTSSANTVVDSSYNYNNITRVGNPGQGTFTPFGTNWSNYFGGTGNYLQTNSTPISTSLSTFTIEAWVYMTATPMGTYGAVIGDMQATISGSNYWSFGVNSSNQIAFYWYSGTGNNVTGSTTMSLNTWYHIAISVNTNTISMYVNGVAQTLTGTTTLSNRSGTLTYLVSGQYNGATSGLFTGYISNLRIVTGTALYSSTFTPPTAPLSVIANTGLLTCQSNRFIDANTTPTTITANTTGAMSVQRFNPFGVNGVPYNTSANTYIGSTYFNGSTDYISSPSNAGFTLGTGDFSIELWMYSNDVSTAQKGPFQISGASGGLSTTYTGGITLIQGANGAASLAGGLTINLNGSYISAGSTAVITTGQWYHIAIVRSGSTVTLYLNGINIASGTNAGNITGTYLALGGYYSTSYLFNGYISNFRVVKGTAVYTANFTPPTAPLSVSTNTSILTAQSTQTVTYDANTIPNSLTVTGTPRPTKSVPFSQSWAGQFNGSTSYLTVANNAAFNLGTTYTIEFWAYRTSSQTGRVISRQDSTTPYNGYSISVSEISANTWLFDASGTQITFSDTALNQWNHYAWVVNSTSGVVYRNGVSVGTATQTAQTPGTNTTLYIGVRDSLTYFYPGYISNLRILKGTALYASNFTPANTPLTAIANTVLLTLQNSSNSNTFIDNSTNAFTITNNGTPGANVVSMAAPGYSPMPIVDSSSAATIYSGSYYFNGTTDYLSIPSTTAFALGTSNFTIEGWFYVTSLALSFPLISKTASTNATSDWNVYISSGYLRAEGLSASAYIGQCISSVITQINTWNHFAWVRSGSNFSLYLNGISVATASSASSVGNGTADPVRLGWDNGYIGNYFPGYISNLRVLNGTALYTPNFTPPTAPFNPSANIAYSGPANTVLLLSGTNVGAYDSTMINDFVDVGSVSVNSNVKQYGTNSYYFNGSSYLTVLANKSFSTFPGDFTIEFWANTLSYSTSGGASMTWLSGTNSSGNWLFLGDTAGVYFYFSTSAVLTATVTNSTSDGWVHWAVSRSAGTLKIFKNGTSYGSVSTSTNYTINNSVLYIGSQSASTGYFTGYMQDLRITNGVGRYTSNFTVPSTPFLAQ